MIRAYIAGPLSGLTPEETKKNAEQTAAYAVKLYKEDSRFIPYVPHLWAFYDDSHEHLPYEDYIRMDLTWLACCDVLIRLPGASLGGAVEVIVAELIGVPIFYESDASFPHVMDIRTCIQEAFDVNS